MSQPRTLQTAPISWRGEDGPYEITLRFAWNGERVECVGVEVTSDGSRPVTARALHSIPLGRLIEKRQPKLGDVNVTVEPGEIAWKGQDVEVKVTGRRGGRPPKYGPEHWNKVANVYRKALAENRTPTRAVARRWDVSESAAAKWVAKCRQLGLLPKTSRGKARAAVSLPPIKSRMQARSRARGRPAATQTATDRRRRAGASLPRGAKGGRK